VATDGDALLAEYGCDAGFGDAVVSTDLLSRVAGHVLIHDVIDIFGAQEALRAGWRALIA
jgi:hypothetical protein